MLFRSARDCSCYLAKTVQTLALGSRFISLLAYVVPDNKEEQSIAQGIVRKRSF